ncbi:thioredoxin family protein [Oceanobacillus sp. AG]|uniref:thioredoxin family protein n=1 Tax=Oceanobacillus sp. AG TaxID=2681969 RepID=UPI0012EC261B|nr:thioredoxin family protein [Oceanobacillus sp. AG]
MRVFQELHSIREIDDFIESHPLSFLYISRTNCSVCHALLPKVQSLLENYPQIHPAHINADDVEAVAGRFSIFTIPVLLLFVEGKEYIREARIVHMDLLEEKLDKIYKNVALD